MNSTLSFDQIEENITRLSKILPDNEVMEYICSIYQRFLPDRDVIPQSPLITNSLAVDHFFKGKEGKVAYSTCHSTTYHLISAAKTRAAESKIGILCLDAHTDVYETDQPLWKGNVFSHLLEKNMIEMLVLFGVPEFRHGIVSEIIPQYASQVIFLDHFVSDEEMTVFFESAFKNITHLFISLDIDGLDTQMQRYTAMEYCEFSVLKNLNSSLPMDINTETAEKIIQEAVWPKNPDGSVKNLRDFGIGLSVEDVSRVLSIAHKYAKTKHIQRGIPSHEGAPILGDIVELNGLDVGGRTAQAVRTLTSKIITSNI